MSIAQNAQYTVRVSETNPGLANLMLEQFGGPQGELAAAMRYFTQALSEDDPGRKDLLMDIATEELSRTYDQTSQLRRAQKLSTSDSSH